MGVAGRGDPQGQRMSSAPQLRLRKRPEPALEKTEEVVMSVKDAMSSKVEWIGPDICLGLECPSP